MDLNYLLTRQQTSLMKADLAACIASRAAHHAFASGYATRIDKLQRASGALARSAWKNDRMGKRS